MPGNTTPRHTWVSFADRWQQAAPGLLLEWRRPGEGGRTWEGLSIWVDGGGSRPWHVHQDWVGAQHLRPLAGASPPPVPVGRTEHTVPRHVWVCVTERWHEAAAGLLLDWRKRVKRGAPWEALAISASGGGMRPWGVQQGWYDAEHVRAAAPGARPTPRAAVCEA